MVYKFLLQLCKTKLQNEMFAIFIFLGNCIFAPFPSLSLALPLCTLGFCNQILFQISISIWICVYHLFFFLPTKSNKISRVGSPLFSCISNYFRSLLLLLLLVSLLFFLSHTLQLTPLSSPSLSQHVPLPSIAVAWPTILLSISISFSNIFTLIACAFVCLSCCCCCQFALID